MEKTINRPAKKPSPKIFRKKARAPEFEPLKVPGVKRIGAWFKNLLKKKDKK